MALLQELDRQGNFLFRWRSYVPIVFLPMIVLAPFLEPGRQQSLPLWWVLVAVAVSVAGQLVRAYTIGHTPKRTSGRNTRKQVAETVNTTGIYSTVRHPLYVGNYLMFIGPALYTGVWYVPTILTLAYWIYYERIMYAEEAFLRGKFGQQYDDWAARTPCFIPSLKNFVAPNLPFSLRNVLGREYNGAYAVVLVFSLQNAVGNYAASGAVALDSGWQVALAVGTVAIVVLRTLKRNTSVLDVEGR